jgi:hypothetical protein
MDLLGPPFTLYASAFLGAAFLWVSLRYGGTGFHKSLQSFIDELADEFRVRTIIELILYSTFGSFLAILCADPITVKQALAAGMGWTGFIGALAPGLVRKTRRA